MYRTSIKRLLDIGGALVLLPLCGLLVLIFGPIIYLTDRGPIFYRSKRLGHNGVPFAMVKFRSMQPGSRHIFNQEGTTQSSTNDPRVTPIGRFLRKTSLDEVPQLINVLAGEMSMIGPRPDLPEDLALYTKVECDKLTVRPGITGYSQAKFRNSISRKEKIKNDLHYIEHLSLKMDFWVLLLTAKTVLMRANVYAKDEGENK